MRTGPTKQEKTTDLKNRLTAYSRKHPAVCKLTDVDPDMGCKKFEIRDASLSG